MDPDLVDLCDSEDEVEVDDGPNGTADTATLQADPRPPDQHVNTGSRRATGGPQPDVFCMDLADDSELDDLAPGQQPRSTSQAPHCAPSRSHGRMASDYVLDACTCRINAGQLRGDISTAAAATLTRQPEGGHRASVQQDLQGLVHAGGLAGLPSSSQKDNMGTGSGQKKRRGGCRSQPSKKGRLAVDKEEEQDEDEDKEDVLIEPSAGATATTVLPPPTTPLLLELCRCPKCR